MILRDIVHNYIPKSMMDRPKSGFSIPLSEWLKTDLISLIEDNFRIAKKFSKQFQDECKACGILSGRGESNVGLRTSFIPLTVANKIEQNLSFDVVELTKESGQNLKNRKEARDRAVIESSKFLSR